MCITELETILRLITKFYTGTRQRKLFPLNWFLSCSCLRLPEGQDADPEVGPEQCLEGQDGKVDPSMEPSNGQQGDPHDNQGTRDENQGGDHQTWFEFAN